MGDYERELEELSALEEQLTNKYKKKLLVNSDLDRRLVSFQANKLENSYRWCKYKEGFSASLVRFIISKTGIKSGTILDPFAGAGTTLFVASELGIDSIGVELLPSSSEIIEVRKLVLDGNQKRIAEQVREFCQERSWKKKGKLKEFPHLRITSGAFSEESEKDLGRYLFEVTQVKSTTLRRVLRFAAMCILESISFTRKDGQYLRWDYRSGRSAGKKKFDKGTILSFDTAITKKLNDIAGDLLGEGQLFDLNSISKKEHGDIQLLNGSCLKILPTLAPGSFDGIITSPPYCNRYDYTRTYALELALLDTGEDELKELRQTMLSCTVENREKTDLDSMFAAVQFQGAQKAFRSQKLLQGILSYLEKAKEDKKINNNGIPRMIRNYFWESALIIFESARLLKPGAPFVMVNDNVRYQGAHIPVDLILSEMAEKAGFEIDTIWVLPRGKGNSSQQMGEHGREEIRKCVYVWRAKASQANSQDLLAVGA
jgi:DNA modification methylase